jgi:hypothetical protein
MLEEVEHLLSRHAALGFSCSRNRWLIAGHDAAFVLTPIRAMTADYNEAE